ncbi:hypothetical protein EKI60_06155 [Candidatus Saccharibacteria bacterium]|nr:MAG: hypothetical protein EKI60_06155 [Candidatus Saccharibacteria bacterium]TXG77562.1 MAG: hypothetical protein E6P97_01495 [Patescibacteria group bacterium]
MQQPLQQSSTIELAERFPLERAGELQVAINRQAASLILSGKMDGCVNLNGACSLVEAHFDITALEAEQIAAESRPQDGDLRGQRQCFWKPRSNPESWWGEETTAPVATYAFMVDQANRYGQGAAEIGLPGHVQRYGKLLMLGWFGGRNDELDFKSEVALFDPSLPLAVKNPLSGEITATLDEVERLNELRGPGAAPVVLMYRGGANAQTPQAWEKEFIKAYEATGGLMIVDLAHGAEMAHDLAGQFEKSVEGQLRSTAHALELAKSGYAAAGYASEMSNAQSPVDPPVPFDLTAPRAFYNARMAQLQS